MTKPVSVVGPCSATASAIAWRPVSPSVRSRATSTVRAMPDRASAAATPSAA